MLPRLDFSQSRRRWEYVRRISAGFGVVFVIQALFTVFSIQARQTLNPLDIVMLSFFGGVSLIATIVYYLKLKRGSTDLVNKVHDWVKERYDLELNQYDSRQLTIPSKTRINDIQGYCSEKVVLWEKDEFGKSHAISLRLFQANSEWILFSAELGEEYPLKAQKDFQVEEEEFFKNMWTEVRQSGGFWSLTKSEHGDGFISGVQEGKMVVLFWSDTLRAELWANSQTNKDEWKTIFVSLDFFKEGVLKQIKRDRNLIGLNWDEKRRFFDPAYLEDLINA